MVLKNYTDMTIYVYDMNNTMVILKPEKHTPSIQTEVSHCPQMKCHVRGYTTPVLITMFAKKNDELKNMPEPKDQILYIVNEGIAGHPANRDRDDVVFPAGHFDVKGNFYVTGLIRL